MKSLDPRTDIGRAGLTLLSATLMLSLAGCDRKGQQAQAQNLPQQAIISGQDANVAKPKAPETQFFFFKDSDFEQYRRPEFKVPELSSIAFFKEYSPSYLAALRDIDAKVAGISNPELRSAEYLRLNNKLDLKNFKKEAESNLKVAQAKFMDDRKHYFDKHSEGWFVAWKFDAYSMSEGMAAVKFTKAYMLAPENLAENVEISLSINDLDSLLYQFKQAATPKIKEGIQKLYKENEESNARLAELGVKLTLKSDDVLWTIVEPQVRKEFLAIIAKGDYLKGVVREMAIVELANGSILKTIDPASVVKPSKRESSKSGHSPESKDESSEE